MTKCSGALGQERKNRTKRLEQPFCVLDTRSWWAISTTRTAPSGTEVTTSKTPYISAMATHNPGAKCGTKASRAYSKNGLSTWLFFLPRISPYLARPAVAPRASTAHYQLQTCRTKTTCQRFNAGLIAREEEALPMCLAWTFTLSSMTCSSLSITYLSSYSTFRPSTTR